MNNENFKIDFWCEFISAAWIFAMAVGTASGILMVFQAFV